MTIYRGHGFYHFYHFIGELGQSNNVFFVTFVWNNYLIPLLNDFNEIQIFSDGASKHFKQSGSMSYFSDLQVKLNKVITYNFFESYHGHSICDAAAAQSKRRVYEDLNIAKSMPTTPIEVADSITKVQNHSAYAMPTIPETNFKVKTMKGISSQREFQFYNKIIQVFELHGDKFSSMFLPETHVKSGQEGVFYQDNL